MNGTIIQQGRFTSDGAAENLDIRSDVDWMEVINETQFATTQTPGRGVKFEWQRGLTDGHAFEYTKADGANTLQAEKVTSGGFTLLTPGAGLGPVVTGTTITKADPPVCTANGHGYSNGDVVVLSNLTEMPQIATRFFTIGNVATNTFELTHFDTNTANFTQESAFQVRKVPVSFGTVDWTNSFATVLSITLGATTQIVTNTDFEALRYVVGDVLKFNIPSQFGTTEISGLSGDITAYTAATNTYTLDIDSSGFTAFAWPASTAVPMSFPEVVKVGNENTSPSNPTLNLGTLSIKLDAGVDGPAGSTSDVIYWKAGKSFSITNA